MDSKSFQMQNNANAQNQQCGHCENMVAPPDTPTTTYTHAYKKMYQVYLHSKVVVVHGMSMTRRCCK